MSTTFQEEGSLKIQNPHPRSEKGLSIKDSVQMNLLMLRQGVWALSSVVGDFETKCDCVYGFNV